MPNHLTNHDKQRKLDFSKPEDNLYAFVKMLGHLDGEPVCGWFNGVMFSVIGQHEVNRPLLAFEGFGLTRTIPQGDGTFINLHKEVLYFKDARTGQILDEWHNPMLDETVKVFHVHNDPVNSRYAPVFKQKFGGDDSPPIEFPFILQWTVMGDDAMTSFDVNTRWKNVLDPNVWVRESAGEWNRVSEYFQLYARLSELENDNLRSASLLGAWIRVSPWQPWMLMGQSPGHLVYRAHTRKLPGGIDELPRHVREYTERNFPEFLIPPSEWKEPNLTSFEVYAREATPTPVKQ